MPNFYQPHKDFIAANLTNSPGTVGTSLIVATGLGASFSTYTDYALSKTGVNEANGTGTITAEIVIVTAIATDTLTVLRAQRGTVAQNLDTTWFLHDSNTSQKMVETERDPATVMDLVEHFFNPTTNGGTIFPNAISNVGSGGSAAGGAPQVGHPGVGSIISGTTVSGFASYLMARATNGSSMHWADIVTFECGIQTPSTVSDTDIRFGMWPLTNGTAPSTGWYFEALAGDTNWFLVTANNGVFDTRQDTGVARAASTWYRLYFRVDGTNIYYGIGTGVTTKFTPTHYPAVSDTPYPQVTVSVNSTAVTRTYFIDYMHLRIVATN